MGVDGGRRARAKRPMALNPTPRATRHTINWTTWPLIGAAGTSGGVVGSYPAVRVRWSAHKNGCMVQVTPPPHVVGHPLRKEDVCPPPPPPSLGLPLGSKNDAPPPPPVKVMSFAHPPPPAE